VNGWHGGGWVTVFETTTLTQLSCDKLYRNSVALLQHPTFFTFPAMTHPAHPHALHHPTEPPARRSVLAWPAWLRVLAVSPVVLALWLAVWWANAGASPW